MKMQINQLNIMKWNVIKYLLKSSKSSGPSVGRQFLESKRISGRKINRISRNVRSNLLRKRVVRTEIVRFWKKINIRKLFWKEGGGWGWGFDLLWLGQVWWVTICVTNRALPYSMSDDILWIVLCWVLVRHVMSLLGKVCDGLSKDLQNCWVVEGTFAISEVSLCFLVESWPCWIYFFEALF